MSAELDAIIRGLATIEDELDPVPLPDETPILIDDREKVANALTQILAAKYPKVRFQIGRYETADYIIGDGHFHRKTTTDLVYSMQTNHMHDEFARLLPSSDKVGLIVEKSAVHNWKDAGRAKAIVRRLGIYLPIFETKDLEDTADTLVWLRRLIVSGEYWILNRRPVIVNHGVSPVAEHYATLWGIGPKLAVALAERYPHPYQLTIAVLATHEYRKESDTYYVDVTLPTGPARIQVTRKGFKTRKAWREGRWDAGIDGFGDGKASQVASSILLGEFGAKEDS